MAILVVCECGQQFQTLDENAGRKARCPDCGRVLLVPKPGALADEDFAALQSVKRRGKGVSLVMVLAGLSLGGVCVISVLAALLLPAVQAAREAARRAQCVNNLKQIGLAMHNYHNTYGCLPPAYTVDKEGKPLLSWRVLLLPYLENAPLYGKFNLEEAWDSPQNFPLSNMMPKTYACPSDPVMAANTTGYQVVVGKPTLFPGGSCITFGNVADGTSNTLMVGEATNGVTWSAPQDVAFASGAGKMGLGSRHPGGFNTLFGDGSVKFIKDTVSPSLFNAILTRAGGEVVSGGSF